MHRSRHLIKTLWAALIGLALLSTPTEFSAVQPTKTVAMKRAHKKAILQKAVKLQTPFVENQGQIPDEQVRFYTKTFGGTAYVTDKGEMIYSFRCAVSAAGADDYALRHRPQRGFTIKESLVGASALFPKGSEPSETRMNYFIGNAADRWRSNVSTFNSVGFGEVYPGIALSLKAHGKNLEKIFLVKPGAGPESIKLKIEWATSLNINDKGELEVGTGVAPIRFAKPLAYQEIKGKRVEVSANYQVLTSNLNPRASSPAYGFRVEDYDKTVPLVIDPALVYSTYLGGSADDSGQAIFTDSAGHAYITGRTQSENFPVQGPFIDAREGQSDAFVTKLSADGSFLIYSTYLGGDGDESGSSIAVDPSGNAIITGITGSTDFPTTSTAYQQTATGGIDHAFVTKLSADGSSLVYSTYLGGDAASQGSGIALDSNGAMYVIGHTDATNFPTKNALYGNKLGGLDAFLAILDPSESGDASLSVSTYLGGNAGDWGYDIALDSLGRIYVAGQTDSSNFPIANGFQSTRSGIRDGFVCVLSNMGGSILYSTYIGGSGIEWGPYGIAVDPSRKAYVTGRTYSSNFPTKNAFQSSLQGTNDAFVTCIDPAQTGLNSLVYSTYLGGSSSDWGEDIAVDGSGNAYVTGATGSSDFPVRGAFQETIADFGDVFVAKIHPTGSPLVFSSFLGGPGGSDTGYGIALDHRGTVCVTGSCGWNFPLVSPYQSSYGGGFDAFLAKVCLGSDCDGDALTDYEEGILGTNPLDYDSDNDGVDDLNDAFPLNAGETSDSDKIEIRITPDVACPTIFPAMLLFQEIASCGQIRGMETGTFTCTTWLPARKPELPLSPMTRGVLRFRATGSFGGIIETGTGISICITSPAIWRLQSRRIRPTNIIREYRATGLCGMISGMVPLTFICTISALGWKLASRMTQGLKLLLPYPRIGSFGTIIGMGTLTSICMTWPSIRSFESQRIRPTNTILRFPESVLFGMI